MVNRYISLQCHEVNDSRTFSSTVRSRSAWLNDSLPEAHLFRVGMAAVAQVVRECKKGFVETLMGEPAAQNTCIVMSGVNGSGKTQAAKDLFALFDLSSKRPKRF
jgi:signal recognition particle GTPase